jgi:hypothetical protein
LERLEEVVREALCEEEKEEEEEEEEEEEGLGTMDRFDFEDRSR